MTTGGSVCRLQRSRALGGLCNRDSCRTVVLRSFLFGQNLQNWRPVRCHRWYSSFNYSLSHLVIHERLMFKWILEFKHSIYEISSFLQFLQHSIYAFIIAYLNSVHFGGGCCGVLTTAIFHRTIGILYCWNGFSFLVCHIKIILIFSLN